MNIYKVKMSAYKRVPVTTEVKIVAKNATEAEQRAKIEWFDRIWLEDSVVENGEIHTDSIEIVKEGLYGF